MSREIGRGRLALGTGFRLNVGNRARIVAKDLAEARERRRAALAGPSVAERQAELIAFYERFEEFVETLCNAAQYGLSDRLESAYVEQRAWFVARYVTLGPYVSAFLASGEEDAFERLFGSENLSGFLAHDDGSVIYLITTAREALSLYAEHLRQLAARKAA